MLPRIGWQKDRPALEHVVGVSLGAPATLHLRHRANGKFERTSVPLMPRSIYHLSGEVRDEWEHSVAAIGVRRAGR